jgi:hypothetical protein
MDVMSYRNQPPSPTMAAGRDPRVGDGFPYNSFWKDGLEAVKARKLIAATIKAGFDPYANQGKAVSKTYTDLCPCGIYPSQCDYHR